MALTLYDSTDIQAIANAIRAKNLKSDTYKVSEMAAAINAIKTEFEVLPQDEVSGAVANFPDGSNGYPIVEAIFGIEPEQTGTGDPSPSNIRPILASNGLHIYHRGANLWNEEYELGDIDPQTGAPISSSVVIRSKYGIPVRPNTTYYKYIGDSKAICLYYYDSAGNFIERDSAGNSTSRAFTTPNNCCYVKFATYNTYGTTYNNDISINYPSTDTSYHAYQGEEISISYPTPPDIIFKGTLNLTTGEITVTHVNLDLGSLTWTIDNSSLSGLARAFVGSLDKPIKWQTPLNCEIFKYNSSTLWSDLSNGDIALTNSEGFPILRIRWEDWDNYTNEQIKSALSGKYMLYELVTPITYQLEPEEMETLTTYYGVNNFWCKSADYGNSDITYRADVALYIDKISS